MSHTAKQEQGIGTTIRRLREERRLSVRTFATKAGFSASFISQVENGQASPSIASLERIAGALDVTLSAFFSPSESEPTIVRLAKRPDITSSWSQAHLEMLGSAQPGNVLEPMMLTLEPGGRSGSHRAGYQGEKFAIVFEGTVELTLDDTRHGLGTGDAISFRGELPHQWENLGTTPARVVIVSTRAMH